MACDCENCGKGWLETLLERWDAPEIIGAIAVMGFLLFCLVAVLYG
jgi:hypothetical protein